VCVNWVGVREREARTGAPPIPHPSTPSIHTHTGRPGVDRPVPVRQVSQIQLHVLSDADPVGGRANDNVRAVCHAGVREQVEMLMMLFVLVYCVDTTSAFLLFCLSLFTVSTCARVLISRVCICAHAPAAGG